MDIDGLAKEENVDKLGELVVELRNNSFYQPILEQLQNSKWTSDLLDMWICIIYGYRGCYDGWAGFD